MLKKLLYINLFSITFLSLFNYLVFHSMNRNAYLESFTSYNQRVTNLAFQNMDKQIMEAAIDIPRLYFSAVKQNEAILVPQDESIEESPALVVGLVNQLEEIKKSYPYLGSLDIYYEGTNTIVTGFSRVHYVKQQQEAARYIPWYKQFLEMGHDSLFLENTAGIYPTRQPMITYVKRISRSKWKGRGIVVAIHLLPSSFGEFIDEEEGTLVITTGGGRILYESPNADRGETEGILDRLHSEALLSVKLKDQPMTAFHLQSKDTGLNYIYYVQNSIFYADYNVRNRIFLMNFLVSVFFNLLILGVFSCFNHYAYKKRLLLFSKEAGITIQDKKQSFDNSLHVLSREISSLHETVKSSKPLLFQNAVRSLILNRRWEMAYETLSEYFHYDCVCTMILYHHDGLADANDVVVGLQKEFLVRNGCYHGLFTTMEKGEIVAVLVFDRGNSQKVYEDFTTEIFGGLKDCTVVSGDLFQFSRENIKASYKSACEVARYRFIFTAKRYLGYGDVEVEGRKESGSHLKLLEAIERDLNSEDFLDFKYRVEGLAVSFKEGNYTIDYCLSTLRDFVTLLYQMVVQKQLDMWIVFGYDIREYYKQIEDIDEFCRWVNELCEVLIFNIRQKKKMVDTDLQGRLASLIDENLEHEISLDFLCDRFSMRPDVLSRTFKQVMGKSYTEYVKEKKLARAVVLMKEGHSMKDIAYRLGYHSPQYFIKIFKEMYGMTPYQYKKNMG